MEATFVTAFASSVFKTFWNPAIKVIGAELQKMKEMDEALRKLEACTEEALDLMHKVHPKCRHEAVKLANYCHKADDLIEMVEHEIKKLNPPTSNSLVHYILISPKNWAKPHKIDELQKKMAMSISDLRQHMDSGQQIQPPFTECHVNNKMKFLGRERDIQSIVEELTCSEKYASYGVSIVGMRGVGKTRLADYILNQEEVQAKFPLILRVSMSGHKFCNEHLESNLHVVYSERMLSLRKRLRDEDSESPFSLLNRDKWLLMVDNLAELSSNTWRDFQTSYLTNGRKLLITTVSTRVGKMARTTVRYLKPLSQKDCEDLIHQEYKLSCNNARPLPSSMSRDLAKQCCGLPLVATFLVWSLPGIERKDEFIDEDLWRWPEFQTEIVPILKSSLMGLESKLIRCFVYFSLFPHEFHFSKEDLIHLWIGERLVLPHVSRFEKNGQDFFDELVDRSILQPQLVENSALTRYEMHKLTHYLARINGSTTHVHMGASSSYELDNYTCHLSLSCDNLLKLWDDIRKHLRRLRTLLLLRGNQQVGKIDKLPDDFFKKVSKLRVLSLRNTDLTDLPRSITKLKHLRYLDISHNGIKKLPEKLANLSTLQILKLTAGLDIPQLPTNFSMLTNLLFVDWNGSHIQKMESKVHNIGNLVNLRTLPLFSVGNKKGYHITELKSMNHIERSIRISNLQNVADEVEAREAMLSHKSSLQRLEFIWARKVRNAEGVLNGLQPPNQLKELKIVDYNGVAFPLWLCDKVTKLQKLELVGCQSCCNLPAIGQLLDLKTLHLEKMSSLKCFDGSFYGVHFDGTGCFRSLETLVLDDMAELQEWGGMGVNFLPCLRDLKIINCPKLETLPSLCHLTSLFDLQIEECKSLGSLPKLPMSLESLIIRSCDIVKNRCQDGGEDWMTIKHIRDVLIDGNKMPTLPMEHSYPSNAENNTYLQGLGLPQSLTTVFMESLIILKCKSDLVQDT